MAYPQALFWTDFETTGLPNGNDFSGVHVLEVAVIVTDFDLSPITGYKEVLKMTKPAADALRGNDYVRNMHLKNNLIKESTSSEATATLEQVEEEIISTLKDKTGFDRGEFMIAGSGVAAYDHPLIKEKMPNLNQWLAYFPFDIGVLRRSALILSHGREFVNPTPKSYQDGVKEHRAWEDVQAHLEEGKRWMEFFRGLP